MKYNPDIHHRRSIRLEGYDYSQTGLYFITLCTQNSLHLFGKITNKKMVLNDAGMMVEKWWNELKNKSPNIELDEFIIMPNHFHGILQIMNTHTVGADLCVCPDVLPHAGPDNTNEHGADAHSDGRHQEKGEHTKGRHCANKHKDKGRHAGLPLRCA